MYLRSYFRGCLYNLHNTSITISHGIEGPIPIGHPTFKTSISILIIFIGNTSCGDSTKEICHTGFFRMGQPGSQRMAKRAPTLPGRVEKGVKEGVSHQQAESLCII